MYKYGVFGYHHLDQEWLFIASADTTHEADDILTEERERFVPPILTEPYWSRLRKCRLLDDTDVIISDKIAELNNLA